MIEQRVAELAAQRVPFVRARVVAAERPTSAKPGDQAIVLPDGTIEGFVGGACAESTVRAQALALLDSGDSLLLRITPSPAPSPDAATSPDGTTGAAPGPGAVGPSAGRITVHNPCLSGGTLEIFLEPVRPAPVLMIVGDTPIARSLTVLGRAMGYQVGSYEVGGRGVAGYEVGADPGPNSAIGATAVVVASHGRDEEEALRAALDAGVEYVGLVASAKRGPSVLASLGMCPSHTSRVSTPAGLDIGARTPDEIALSILAEIVSRRPRPTGRAIVEWDASGVGGAVDAPGLAKDPVCAMTVAMVDASLHLDQDGTRWWFCGSGCLRAFAASPGDYVSATV